MVPVRLSACTRCAEGRCALCLPRGEHIRTIKIRKSCSLSRNSTKQVVRASVYSLFTTPRCYRSVDCVNCIKSHCWVVTALTRCPSCHQVPANQLPPFRPLRL
ncbi:hypothetical protein VTK56DRAFT_2322 [Thermocarpiscus australiensis]